MKREELKEEFSKVNNRLDQYNHHLQEHMARTKSLEKLVEIQTQHFDLRQKAIEDRIEKQEDRLYSLPARVLQFVSILGGIAALLKIVL